MPPHPAEVDPATKLFVDPVLVEEDLADWDDDENDEYDEDDNEDEWDEWDDGEVETDGE